MAWARDLIPSQINIASSEMYLFTNCSSYSACIMMPPLNPLVSPFFLHNHVYVGDNLRLARNGFSARHKYCWDTSHSCNVIWNEFEIAEIKALWLSCIEIWGAHFTSESSALSVMAGSIAEVLSCCPMLILLCNRQNIAAYEVYWFVDFPIINLWGVRSPFFVLKHHACTSQKSKQACIRKNLKFTGNRDHINKK